MEEDSPLRPLVPVAAIAEGGTACSGAEANGTDVDIEDGLEPYSDR